MQGRIQVFYKITRNAVPDVKAGQENIEYENMGSEIIFFSLLHKHKKEKKNKTKKQKQKKQT